MPLFLGIDVGTSSVKCIVVDEKLNTVKSATIAQDFMQPAPLHTEQDPDMWWDNTKLALKEMFAAGVDPKEIAGISFSGQMHGLVCLDKDMKPIRPAILWNDLRTVKECEEIISMFGVDGLVSHINNYVIPGYTVPKILWLKKNEPANYEKMCKFALPKDYIRLKLTGEVATDVADASGTGIFDVETKQWAYGMIDALGIDRAILPDVYECAGLTGKVTAEAAAETGLPEGVPVYGGAGDAVCQVSGMGVCDPAALGLIIGTSGVVSSPQTVYSKNNGGRLQYFCSTNGDDWQAIGCQLNSGGSMAWANKNILCQGTDFKMANELALEAGVGAKKLFFMPYLGGERCPFNDANARGVYFGMTYETGLGEIARATMEGITFGLYQIFDLVRECNPAVKPEYAITSGGGSKSPLWLQIQADIFNMPMRIIPASGEGGAFGAAMLAGIGAGVWKSTREAASLLEVSKEILPGKDAERYAELYSVYKDLYANMKPSFDALAKI